MKIPNDWKKVLEKYLKTEKYLNLQKFVEKEYLEKEIFPAKENIFRAFSLTPLEKVKVVIVGQDPYHTPKIATGLAFSVAENAKIPPSIKNIYKEIESDLGIKKDFKNANLENWAEQGVLLLNQVLTVESHKAGSHQKKGWEEFSENVVKELVKSKENLVFILWGKNAQKLEEKILFENNKKDKNKKHLILKSAHPSPFAAYRGFFGNKHFSKTNNFLTTHNLKKINW